ncbi:hypothetical protein JXI42_12750 [bacterium]|nr:hypothetical protein [bacterium]
MNDTLNKTHTSKLIPLISVALNGVLLALGIVIVIILLSGGYANKGNISDLDHAIEYANSLLNNELYNEAIFEFEEILRVYAPDAQKAANIIYTTGNIYYADLRDFKGALKQYLKLKTLYPDSPLLMEANKKIVSCLDYLGRSAQAQQTLEESVVLGEKSATPKGGKVVAKIGSRDITMRELNAALNRLPDYLLEEFKGPTGKYNFLNQYVGQELMYDMALRRGYDKNQEVIDDLHEVTRQILIRKIYQDEIGGKLEIKDEDIKFYYEQHKDEYADKTMDEAVQEIQKKLQMQKMQILEQELIRKMMDAEGVRFFPESLGVDPDKLEQEISGNQ